jgi:dethiobiotin synthetase
VKRWFVTGTDTGIGKTRVACALVRHLVAKGHRVAAMKPVASGCDRTPAGLRNEDAVLLAREMNVDLAYEQVNPYAFEPAIAPHIAADAAGVEVDPGRIASIAGRIDADHLVIEGVGGWCVPLGRAMMLADLVDELDARVLLVVGMRLGCISHALLTCAQIERDGLDLVGWLVNRVDPNMIQYGNNLKTLRKHIRAPLLAELAWEGKQLNLQSEINDIL